jgi:hypothetical protein
MDQFVEISYNPDPERTAIRVDVTSRPGFLRLIANKSGMAELAGLVADFLTYLKPEDLDYTLTEQTSLLAGSPSLVFLFDAGLDDVDTRDPAPEPSLGVSLAPDGGGATWEQGELSPPTPVEPHS